MILEIGQDSHGERALSYQPLRLRKTVNDLVKDVQTLSFSPRSMLRFQRVSCMSSNRRYFQPKRKSTFLFIELSQLFANQSFISNCFQEILWVTLTLEHAVSFKLGDSIKSFFFFLNGNRCPILISTSSFGPPPKYNLDFYLSRGGA